MKKTVLITMCALLATSLAFAQGARRGGRGGQQRGQHQGAAVLNLASPQTITGAITAVDIAYGTEYPSITVDGKTIKVAPVWYFLEKDFELKAGDAVSVVAVSSTVAGDSYLYALTITKSSTKATLTLRDEDGFPQWAGMRGGRRGNGEARGRSAECIDLASVTTVAGVVEKVTMGAGIQNPSLVVKQDNGTLVTMKIGPERILLEADFELKAGDKVTAKYAHCTCEDENIAFELTKPAGVKVVLREDDGTPAWD